MSSKTKTPATNEATMPARVPKLRFPEFRGAWKEKRIKTLGYFTGGGTPSKENSAYWNGEIPWISSSDLTEESIFQINVTRFITKQAIQESATKLVPAKSILLISRVGVGKLAISTFPLCTSQDFTNFTPTDADPLFLAYQLKSRKETLLSFNQGTSIKGFTKDNIANLELGFPSPAEQQKIAECLSSLDELMAAQARKVDALKTHKKGLMQQLFPREEETRPRLRFPEFQNNGEWEMRELSDFITERSEYPKEKVPLFSLTIEDGVTPKTERYERSFLVNDETDAYKLVLPNDFAFNPMNLRFGAIGRHSGTEKVAVSKYYNIFSCDKTVDSRFCEMYFRSERMVAFYDDRAIGSLIEKRRVHFAAFLKFNIHFPQLPEQQRIAACLSSLDALITAEAQKLEALKTHKKALMQQLFPSTEEVDA